MKAEEGKESDNKQFVVQPKPYNSSYKEVFDLSFIDPTVSKNSLIH